MDTPYTFSMSGCRPATIFGLVVAVAFIAFGWTMNAPWYALAPALIVAPMMLYTIIANPTYGMRLDPQALELDRNGKIRRILLSTIDHIRISTWTDSDMVTIHLKDGSREPLSHMMRPPKVKLREVLAAHKITITDD